MNDAKPTQTILFFGNSILIERLASKLRKLEGWDITQRVGDEPGDLSGVDFIVVDLRDGKTTLALNMLRTLPGVVLLGMDAIANTITLMSQVHPARSMQEVLDALKEAM